jgi:menaquinone-dependent protoporphyrinogen IX oxidase
MTAIAVYASKYGSTKGIAEFIAEKLRQPWNAGGGLVVVPARVIPEVADDAVRLVYVR